MNLRATLQLSPDAWRMALSLLDEALLLPPAQRTAWLEALAPQHRPLRAALQQLLDDRQALETGDFLQALPSLGAQLPAHGLEAGQHVGPWLLLRELGQGGMASVWLALSLIHI